MKNIKTKTLIDFLKKSKTAEIYYLDKLPFDKSKVTQLMNKSGKIIVIHEDSEI